MAEPESFDADPDAWAAWRPEEVALLHLRMELHEAAHGAADGLAEPGARAVEEAR